jgi:hypothetical protein
MRADDGKWREKNGVYYQELLPQFSTIWEWAWLWLLFLCTLRVLQMQWWGWVALAERMNVRLPYLFVLLEISINNALALKLPLQCCRSDWRVHRRRVFYTYSSSVISCGNPDHSQKKDLPGSHTYCTLSNRLYAFSTVRTYHLHELPSTPYTIPIYIIPL